MGTQRLIPRFLIALGLLLCSQLIACGSQGASNSQGPSTTQPTNGSRTSPLPSQSDGWVPPVLLRNPSPGQLEVFISVTMGGYDRTTRETSTIGLAFQPNGRPVQFVGQERLSCNGIRVPLHHRVAAFQVAEAPTSALEGKTFVCTYSASNASTSLVFTVPHASVIRSPLDQAQLLRRTTILITYKE